MKFGNIRDEKIISPLEQLRHVRPVGNGRHFLQNMAPLMLTSLIDAFAVIVIYLLASTQNGGQEMKMDSSVRLPIAQHSQNLEIGVNLRIKGTKYIIDETELEQSQIAPFLTQLNETLKKNSDKRVGHLVIQADKAADFKELTPVLLIAAQTGFENVRFAVLGE